MDKQIQRHKNGLSENRTGLEGVGIAATVKLAGAKLRMRKVLDLLQRFVLGKLVRVGNGDLFGRVVFYLLLNYGV
jgi:hypothetical protein